MLKLENQSLTLVGAKVIADNDFIALNVEGRLKICNIMLVNMTSNKLTPIPLTRVKADWQSISLAEVLLDLSLDQRITYDANNSLLREKSAGRDLKIITENPNRYIALSTHLGQLSYLSIRPSQQSPRALAEASSFELPSSQLYCLRPLYLSAPTRS